MLAGVSQRVTNPSQNDAQLGFFFLKKEDAESLIEKVSQSSAYYITLIKHPRCSASNASMDKPAAH